MGETGAEPTGRRRQKVLLADDVELFLELERSFLQRENIDILVARNGQEALEIVRRERPDVVLLDLYMPLMNGVDVCRAVKADPSLRGTPVLMVTQGGRDEEQRLCRDAGCDAILLKPINRHVFLGTVRESLQIVERMAPRVPARLGISYGPEGRIPFTGFTVNLSTGGVFIETREPLSVNSPLRATFTIPGRDGALVCAARVAWINPAEGPLKANLPPGMGIQFLDLSFEERAALLTLVKERLLFPA